MDTVIETNYCTGQLDEDSAGIDSRASSTTIRYNKVVGCKGAGVRLGGHKVGHEQYGVDCKVRARGVFCSLLILFLCVRLFFSFYFDCACDDISCLSCLGFCLYLAVSRVRLTRPCTLQLSWKITPRPPPLQVYCNILENNEFAGVKVMTEPNQICQNTITGSDKAFRGDAAKSFEEGSECPFEVKPPQQDIETTRWFQNCKP